jgi:hypothetical protein
MAETLAFGSLDDQSLLDVTLDAADAADSEVFLYFQPALGGIGGSIAEALGEAVAYSPELMVDGQVTQGSGFPVFGSTDIFGGGDPLGSGDEPQLVSLRLVVTRQAPGYPEDAFVRTIIDRASGRDRAAGALTPESLRPLEVGEAGPTALVPLHHVMISTGGANPRRVALERAQMARFVGENLLDPEEASDFAMSDLLWPVAVVDKALVLASERAIVPSLAEAGAVAAYVARPRVYLTSIGPSASGADSFSFVTDLLADDVRLIAPGSEPVADAPARRIWYGAAQTAMETEYVLGIVRGLDPATRSVEAVSLSMSEPLTVIEGGDALEVSVAREALQEAVGSGLVAVVPGSPIAADVWWTIDPASGQTRSILDPGLAAGRGAGNNYVNSSQGNTYYVDEQGNTWVRKTGGGGPPSRCSPGQEYVAIVGCVSVPAAWAIRGTVTVAVTIAVGYAATALWQAALGI